MEWGRRVVRSAVAHAEQEAVGMDAIFEKLSRVAERPYEAVSAWKRRHGGKVVAHFPMHAPGEIAHAAGALPFVLQESPDPVTVGHAHIYPYYCGLCRSVVDDAARGTLGFVDCIVGGDGDNCVQGLGAADLVMLQLPEVARFHFSAPRWVREPWSVRDATNAFRGMKATFEELTGRAISDDAMWRSIDVFNRNRSLIREIYDLRRSGASALGAERMLHIVKSSMVMDKAEHNALLESLIPQLRTLTDPHPERVPVFVSGHMCQAPKVDVLNMIEDAGCRIVDDDLYHGFRYVAADVGKDLRDPLEALGRWYSDRNRAVPCPTRIDPEAEWDKYLLQAVKRCSASGMIILQARFCEPHMYAYPEIKETFESAGVPHLLIETEHEDEDGSLAAMRTRIEAFVDTITKQKAASGRATSWSRRA
jgi:bcr-type benzoyl-CoA reductase subunit C